MIKNEWKFIGTHKLILASVCAIMLIPFLYCIFFLKSVWDPYGNAGKLPVAVVNLDQPVKYQGKTLNVGEQTTDNLRKNHELGWHIVSEKQAAQGLKDRKYYSVITFPKDFSKNASTVTDATPKQMHFNYKTNDSANYIAEVLSQVGASTLNSQIRAQITKAYAEATFAQVKTIGKQMTKAANGSNKISKNLTKLNNGLGKLSTGANKLAAGEDTMYAGVIKLADGSARVSDGLNQYTAGVSTLSNGLQTIKTKIEPLPDSVNKLAGGTNTLAKAIDAYTGGVGQLNSGINTLASSVPALQSGGAQLLSGSSALSNGLNTLNSKSAQLQSGSAQLASNTQSVSEAIAKLGAGAQQAKNQLGALQNNDTLKNLQEISQSPDTAAAMQSIAKLQNDLKSNQGQELVAQLVALQQNVATLQKAAPTIQAAAQNTQQSATELNLIASSIGDVSSSASATQSAIEKAQSALSDVKDADEAKAAIADAASAASKTTSEAQGLSDAKSRITGVSSKLGNTTSELAALGNSGTSSMPSVAALSNILGDVTPLLNNPTLANINPSQVSSLASDLNKQMASLGELTQLLDGNIALNAKVNGGSETLQGGMNALASGIAQYTAGTASASDGANKLHNGINTLSLKLPKLVTGVEALQAGANKLNKNSGALVSGATKVAAGTSQLNAAVPALYGGLSQAANGAATLDSKSGELRSGAAQVANGNGQLPSGVAQLQSGAHQIATGITSADNGSKQLAAGSGKLTNGLQDGVDKVNNQPLSDKNAKMFAEPVSTTHSNYSYVPNYGHALAPYVLSVALFVGALVFNFAFPIRRISMNGQSATAWFMSKVSVGTVVALGMGIFEPALMMVGGLKPDHVGQFFFISIMFALASMFIVMFLSMLLDNPGRLLAMILLMLQLGGSGGTFPMEVTNHFYNVIHPYLPMTYSIYGFRQALTSGMGNTLYGQSVGVLFIFLVLSLVLLWVSMVWLQRHHLAGISQLTDNQKLQALDDEEPQV